MHKNKPFIRGLLANSTPPRAVSSFFLPIHTEAVESGLCRAHGHLERQLAVTRKTEPIWTPWPRACNESFIDSLICGLAAEVAATRSVTRYTSFVFSIRTIAPIVYQPYSQVDFDSYSRQEAYYATASADVNPIQSITSHCLEHKQQHTALSSDEIC